MKHRRFALAMSALALGAASFAANAAIVFQNLGVNAPRLSWVAMLSRPSIYRYRTRFRNTR